MAKPKPTKSRPSRHKTPKPTPAWQKLRGQAHPPAKAGVKLNVLNGCSSPITSPRATACDPYPFSSVRSIVEDLKRRGLVDEKKQRIQDLPAFISLEAMAEHKDQRDPRDLARSISLTLSSYPIDNQNLALHYLAQNLRRQRKRIIADSQTKVESELAALETSKNHLTTLEAVLTGNLIF